MPMAQDQGFELFNIDATLSKDVWDFGYDFQAWYTLCDHFFDAGHQILPVFPAAQIEKHLSSRRMCNQEAVSW